MLFVEDFPFTEVPVFSLFHLVVVCPRHNTGLCFYCMSLRRGDNGYRCMSDAHVKSADFQSCRNMVHVLHMDK